MYQVGVIGAGNMGRAMVGAWIDSETLEAGDVIVTDRDTAKVEEASEAFGVRGGSIEEASGAGVVLLAVKPQDAGAVLDSLEGNMRAGQVLLSIAAGLTIASIRRRIGAAPSIVRVMPNMAAKVRSAVSGYAVDAGEGEFREREVTSLLMAVGDAVKVEEDLMNLVTAISGSGPAYFFYLTEALEEAAIEMGMDARVASTLARGTLWGAARTVRDTGSEPGDLRKAVSSPGGTTLAALSEMDSSGFTEMMKRAVEAAALRAAELAT